MTSWPARTQVAPIAPPTLPEPMMPIFIFSCSKHRKGQGADDDGGPGKNEKLTTTLFHGNSSTSWIIRFLMAASGSRPTAPPMLSAMFVGLAGGRRDGRDGGMARYVFEEELGPGVRVEFARPVGHLAPLHPLPEPRAAERHIDQDANALVARERQDGLLDGAIVDGVVDADEVDALVAHGLRQRRRTGARRWW